MNPHEVRQALNDVLTEGAIVPADNLSPHELCGIVHDDDLSDFNKKCRNLVLERKSSRSGVGESWTTVQIQLTDKTREM